MKSVVSTVLAVVVGLALLAPAAFADDRPPASGFLGNPSVYDLLTKGPTGAYRYLKPGVDFKKYNKYMVDSVIFFLADAADYKGIDPQEMKDLCDAFNKELADAFKDKWPIVAEPGPDVARLRIAITNVKPSRPGVSTVTSILPVGLGLSLIKRGTTGGWSGSGETAVEMMVLDTTTNELIAMGMDQKAAAFDERFSKWGSAKDAFKFWSEQVVKNIDALHGVKR